MRNQVKRAMAVMALSMTIASPIALSTAQAATSEHTMEKAAIVVNGKTFSQPYKFVGGVPATTYMPIYYVQQVINKALGISSSADVWNGNKHTWSITVSGKTPKVLSHGVGSAVVLNGTTIEDAPTIADVDPASGKATTFMPIWYVQQTLNELLGLNGMADKWNGAATVPTWTITTQGNSATSVGSGNSTSATGNETSSNVPTDAQLQAQAKVIYDKITWKVQGNYRVFTAPLELYGSAWELISGTATGPVQYSLDNGSTWTTPASEYDSLDLTQGGVKSAPNGISDVLLRAPKTKTVLFALTRIGKHSNAGIGRMGVSSNGTKSISLTVVGKYTG